MTIVKTATSFAVLAILAAFATPAIALADEPKVRISFGAGVTAGAIDGSASWGGSAGYRFADRLSFDVEVTAIDKPADRFNNRYFSLGGSNNLAVTGMARVGNIVATQPNQRGGQQPFGPVVSAQMATAPGFAANTDGNTLLGTMGFRYELPSQDARFRPYVNAGFGVARTKESFNVAIATPVQPTPGRGNAAPVSNTITINQDQTHTGLLMGAGGGASLRLVAQLSLDVDARYYRLDRGRNLGRFGAGFSYRF